MTDLALVVGLVGCVMAAAVLAIAEVSLLRVRRTQLLADSHSDPRARRLLPLLDDLPVVLNVVLLLVLLAQVGAATIGAVLAGRWFGGVGIPAMSMIVTIGLFIYGEALPKTRAVVDPRRSALRVAPMLRIAVRVLRRPVALLLRVIDLQLRGEARHDVATEAELRLLARQAADVGEIEPDDAVLVERSFRFGDLAVRHVMVPRSGIRFVEADESAKIGFSRALAFGHRRLPVVAGSLDDVIGVVRLRDLAAASAHAEGDDAPRAAAVMTPPLFCSADDSLASVLRTMQDQEQWIAIVELAGGHDTGADNTGGRDTSGHGEPRNRRTVGLVTIEDIVAELVGEISDD